MTIALRQKVALYTLVHVQAIEHVWQLLAVSDGKVHLVYRLPCE